MAASAAVLPASLRGVSAGELETAEVLFLKDRGLNDDDCAAIAPYLSRNKALRQLYIGYNAFGDAGARHLCVALAAAAAAGSRLELLGLRHCRLGDAAAGSVAELLPACPALAEVGLDENEISDAGFDALASALAAGSTLGLRRLYLGQNRASEEARGRLQRSAPPGLALHFSR
eukprot:TRINITY_DN30738_c0_g1_i1.p1 TRINITY_DN30738_c0_g1~~TRINITY_DN30738_c0_g1_i1.p1  ORF type:complete len:189 (-),score=54.46 TRINITY_DN30738_c0_g1_i1:158-679(-)